MKKLISNGKNEYISEHEDILFTTGGKLHDADVVKIIKILHDEFDLKTTIVALDSDYEVTIKNK